MPHRAGRVGGMEDDAIMYTIHIPNPHASLKQSLAHCIVVLIVVTNIIVWEQLQGNAAEIFIVFLAFMPDLIFLL